MHSASDTDIQYMTRALALAREGLGCTWPNPCVGCVVVKDESVVGEARTADGGRPHAEPQALTQAGERAKGATVYVTLEPCNTHGKTPPCVEALIAAGVSRVVMACLDPFQTGQGGLERLRESGIEVLTGVCQEAAEEINEGFFLKIKENRPMVSLKTATSLDGRIALQNGESQWITGEVARRRAHELRACHDAVLAGIGTILADDPLLTVRLGDEKRPQPVRIVLDPSLKLPLESRIVESVQPDSQVWAICHEDAAEDKREMLSQKGISVLPVAAKVENFIEPKDILFRLAEEGITRLLVEGGGATVTAFLKAECADYLYWFRASCLIGGDGIPAIQAFGLEDLSDTPRLTLEGQERLGDDFLDIWRIGTENT